MAIRPIKTPVTDNFPPARLYVDDVEEILRILTEAAENQQEESFRAQDEQLKINLRVGNQQCDELADLKKIHPPFTHDFNVGVSKSGFTAYVELNAYRSMWHSYGQTETEEWGTFHSLDQVFAARKRSWKSFLHSHRHACFALQGAATAAMLLLWIPIVFSQKTGVVAVAQVACLALIISLWLGLRNHSILVLREYSDYSSQRNQTVWKIVPDAVKIIFGFLLGILTLYLKHRFWP